MTLRPAARQRWQQTFSPRSLVSAKMQDFMIWMTQQANVYIYSN